MVHERTTAGDQVGCCFVSNVGFRLRAAVETEFDAVTEVALIAWFIAEINRGCERL